MMLDAVRTTEDATHVKLSLARVLMESLDSDELSKIIKSLTPKESSHEARLKKIQKQLD